jgi:hypothetical protein
MRGRRWPIARPGDDQIIDPAAIVSRYLKRELRKPILFVDRCLSGSSRWPPPRRRRVEFHQSEFDFRRRSVVGALSFRQGNRPGSTEQLANLSRTNRRLYTRHLKALVFCLSSFTWSKTSEIPTRTFLFPFDIFAAISDVSHHSSPVGLAPNSAQQPTWIEVAKRQ